MCVYIIKIRVFTIATVYYLVYENQRIYKYAFQALDLNLNCSLEQFIKTKSLYYNLRD